MRTRLSATVWFTSAPTRRSVTIMSSTATLNCVGPTSTTAKARCGGGCAPYSSVSSLQSRTVLNANATMFTYCPRSNSQEAAMLQTIGSPSGITASDAMLPQKADDAHHQILVLAAVYWSSTTFRQPC